MAEASDLSLLHIEEFAADEIEEQEDRPETLDSPPSWPSATAPAGATRCALGPDLFAPDPSDPGYSDQDSDCSDDHATLAFDLFDRSSTRPICAATDPFSESLQSPNFRASEGPEEVGSDYLGLGSGFEDQEDGEDADREVVVSDWGADYFFMGRRSSPSESIDFSGARPVDSEGLRIAGFDSDSDSDEQIVDGGESQDRINDDLGLPLCWDCLQLEEQRRDLSIEMEWEEVDERLEDRDVLSIMVVGNDEIPNGLRERNHDEAEQEEDVVRNIDWEVLLAVNNLGRNNLDPEDVESFFVDDHEGFVYTSDYEAYEVLFGQFADHDSSLKGSPPAAKSVVENLPSVMMAKEDVDENNNVCAVCKDGILVREKVKRLPCSHHYHEDCILPWLSIRNTCPLCRFELPTDDPEYEKWKARRATSGGSGEDSQLRYEFEILPEA
ncbi:E3 ubiquitin-protein ligase Praja-2-like [Phoenix dactylifera]|uniref:RING-type E3 ubiquitin transferase n=1 Tax=Phoenix dactylifera TaxID=42345 RepID=A0A8B7CUU1_PHODC|nr:E3 ubiquitin-protein ligase Praja-2-like [Phoenix dactylifera]